MPRIAVQDRREAVQVRSGVNGNHPMISPTVRSAGQGIGPAQIKSLLWVILFVALIITALAMATGTIAMIVRSVFLLFGYTP